MHVSRMVQSRWYWDDPICLCWFMQKILCSSAEWGCMKQCVVTNNELDLTFSTKVLTVFLFSPAMSQEYFNWFYYYLCILSEVIRNKYYFHIYLWWVHEPIIIFLYGWPWVHLYNLLLGQTKLKTTVPGV